MAIGYTRETWVDGVQLVDAARLNNIETGVQAACDELDEFYDSSTKAITAPGDVNIQEVGANINIGSPSIWVLLDAYLSSLRLQSLNLLELIAGDAFQSLTSQFALKNYGGDIIIQNYKNSVQVHGDIKLVTDGQALYNGVEIATKAEVGESGTDLNTLTSEGMYQIQNPNNAPSGVTGWVTLSVIPTSNDATYCRQMLYIPSSDDMYTRNNVGGTWGSWNKIALKSDLAVNDITNNITVTPGSTGTITITKAVKTGHYVEIYGVLTATQNTSAGSNIAVATLSGIPAPVSANIPLGSSIALFGESLIGVVMSDNGTITARYYIGSVYSAGSSSVFKFGYITAD